MRLPGLSFPAVLLVALFSISQTLMAQHGGGGSSAGSSSGASGGGSHGGGGIASGGSSSHGSGGGHSSGGFASHASGSHGSGWRSSTAHSNPFRSNTKDVPFRGLDKKDNGQAPKRGFLSFLRHPFARRASEKPELLKNFRHRICLNGTCRVCPVAEVPGHGGCVPAHIYLRNPDFCSRANVGASSCLPQTSFVDDCAAARIAMEQQARRLREAGAARDSECANLFSQQCVDLTSSEERESSLYQALQDKYKRCQVRSRGTATFGSNPFLYRGADSLVKDADH